MEASTAWAGLFGALIHFFLGGSSFTLTLVPGSFTLPGFGFCLATLPSPFTLPSLQPALARAFFAALRVLPFSFGTTQPTYSKRSLRRSALVPASVVTVIWTRPAIELLGATAVIWFSESTVKLVAAFLPNFTSLAPFRSSPLIVTFVPPVTDPEKFSSFSIEGAGCTSALSSISFPFSVPLGATVAPLKGDGKIKP